MTRYLTLEDVLRMCARLDLKVRDLGLLDSAVHRPRAGFAGQEAYPTLELKAAALLHSITKNHALFDGNKRLAWMATDIFLARHGLSAHVTHGEAVDLVLRVAAEDVDLDFIVTGLNIAPDD